MSTINLFSGFLIASEFALYDVTPTCRLAYTVLPRMVSKLSYPSKSLSAQCLQHSSFHYSSQDKTIRNIIPSPLPALV